MTGIGAPNMRNLQAQERPRCRRHVAWRRGWELSQQCGINQPRRRKSYRLHKRSSVLSMMSMPCRPRGGQSPFLTRNKLFQSDYLPESVFLISTDSPQTRGNQPQILSGGAQYATLLMRSGQEDPRPEVTTISRAARPLHAGVFRRARLTRAPQQIARDVRLRPIGQAQKATAHWVYHPTLFRPLPECRRRHFR